jgi:hypothetical protein|tara:strand:+ start:1582 stop:1737 length:156 start_codon:yes stop_codon:yes gene_type:complete
MPELKMTNFRDLIAVTLSSEEVRILFLIVEDDPRASEFRAKFRRVTKNESS